MRGIKWRTKIFVVIAIIIFCVALAIGGIVLYGKYQISKIPQLSFMQALEYTTQGNREAVITVGIIKNGQSSYKVYGEDGKELRAELHTYEIGSLTKTFTAALINKAIMEGKVKIDDTIDNYLPLPDGAGYPTIKELLTHTSGYRAYYFEGPMIFNFVKDRNDFYAITKEMVLCKASGLHMNKDDYGFTYSNYGYAVLGLVLESIYGTDYTTLINDVAQNELKMSDTKISDQSGDLGNYWDWKENDAYLPAGGITSNILDMLFYAQMQLESNLYFSECHKSLKTINASAQDYKTMGINMDAIGMSWIIDSENGVIWHNGGTGDYNSYLGFHPETGTAVVVLSNLAPSDRIPATVLGVKLLMELTSKNM